MQGPGSDAVAGKVYNTNTLILMGSEISRALLRPNIGDDVYIDDDYFLYLKR